MTSSCSHAPWFEWHVAQQPCCCVSLMLHTPGSHTPGANHEVCLIHWYYKVKVIQNRESCEKYDCSNYIWETVAAANSVIMLTCSTVENRKQNVPRHQADNAISNPEPYTGLRVRDGWTGFAHSQPVCSIACKLKSALIFTAAVPGNKYITWIWRAVTWPCSLLAPQQYTKVRLMGGTFERHTYRDAFLHV
jgi:hypothetical protein